MTYNKAQKDHYWCSWSGNEMAKFDQGTKNISVKY